MEKEKKIKLSSFADDTMLYMEYPKDTTRKLIEFINEFGSIVGYKINTKKKKH